MIQSPVSVTVVIFSERSVAQRLQAISTLQIWVIFSQIYLRREEIEERERPIFTYLHFERYHLDQVVRSRRNVRESRRFMKNHVQINVSKRPRTYEKHY